MTHINDAEIAYGLKLRAEEAAKTPERSLLERVIPLRKTILELRDKGHATSQIKKWLGEQHLHIAEGTLRNYIARIVSAERQARDEGIQETSDADILRICKGIVRAKITPPNSNELCAEHLPGPPAPRQSAHMPAKKTPPSSSSSTFTPRPDNEL
ncbi:hypothetical protein A3734_15270 [Sulfitobacter sp. HI0054]|uniref:hypothetical protein n=1 Tax=Sulfitobacter sp. HI0054 TaxID=1822238 RepID=UPI0007C21944|nr:hypothetical protein [Sulfitobacter sp. HI0054]KZY53503.1 hypothetical protein A3734_15270 [Sulfitobacter sp. HI0054]